MQTLEIEHPAAKILTDIAKSQDAEVGDGTTSVVVLAGEFLTQAKGFIEDGIHPQCIIRAFRKACELAQEHLKTLAVPVSPADRRVMLERCARTALYSKLIAHHRDFFSNMAVEAVLSVIDAKSVQPGVANLDLIGIKKVAGGSSLDSILVPGVAFKKTFSYAGFEMQPRSFANPKILSLNIELELKAEKDNAEVRLKDPSQYQALVDAEWQIIFDKLDKCVASGANIVLSRLPIGDLATQYFADRDIFCAGRVPEEDIMRVFKATGAKMQHTVNDLKPSVLGTCALFEERQIGSERYNFFTGCNEAKTCTIILRGGADQFVEETERSLHDAMMIVKRAVVESSVVAGGGAVEMELLKYLRDHSRTITGVDQIIIAGFAQALEVIPRQVAENAGLDSTDVLNRLRTAHHSEGGAHFGVDVENEANQGVCDTFASFIWQPTLVVRNALTAATEATCLILSVDETIQCPESEKPAESRPAGGGRIGQMGMRGLARGRGARVMRGRGGK